MDDRGARRAPAQHRAWRGLVVGLVVVLAVAAVPLVVSAFDDDAATDGRRVVKGDAVAQVRAAFGQTTASARYETDYTTSSTAPIQAPEQCGQAPDAHDPSRERSATQRCFAPTGERRTTFTGHGVVNLEPYAMVADTTAGTYGHIVLHVNSTTVWQLGGATVGYANGAAPGIPLSSYAGQVEGSLGRGPGALAVIGLASRGGYLNLEEEAVAGAEPVGTGTVDGFDVTYYDVTIDLTQLANVPGLSDVQRDTIAAALPLLEDSGYEGTSERIGVSADGFVREVTTVNHFADGSTSSRHTILSNFGCAPTVYTPDQTPPDVDVIPPCAVGVTTTTTTAAPTTTAPPLGSSSTVPGTTSPASSAPPTSTTAPAPPSTSLEPPTTTPGSP